MAVGALAAACTTAAFADTYSFSAKYDETTGKVKLLDFAEYKAKVGNDADLTLLVLSSDIKDAEGANVDITSANANNVIKQIDQKSFTVGEEVTVGTLAKGTYYVRLGGLEVNNETNPNGFLETSFKVGSDNPWADSTRKVGDTVLNDEIDGADLVALNLHIAGKAGKQLTGAALQAADTVDNGEIDGADLVREHLNIANPTKNPFAVTYIKDKTNYVSE